MSSDLCRPQPKPGEQELGWVRTVVRTDRSPEEFQFTSCWQIWSGVWTSNFPSFKIYKEEFLLLLLKKKTKTILFLESEGKRNLSQSLGVRHFNPALAPPSFLFPSLPSLLSPLSSTSPFCVNQLTSFLIFFSSHLFPNSWKQEWEKGTFSWETSR